MKEEESVRGSGEKGERDVCLKKEGERTRQALKFDATSSLSALLPLLQPEKTHQRSSVLSSKAGDCCRNRVGRWGGW